ncbi:MAG: hypothetical protein ACFE8B_06415 [Candidatus Hermodarchaeota archaeon]
MSELITRIKKKRIYKEQISFAEHYRHCNRCEKYLNIDQDEEIVCAICGETFCNDCIKNHQQFSCC